MIQLDLAADEQAILRELLETQLSDLRMEIAGTDSLDFRDHLRGRKAVLQKVLDVLGGPEGSAP
ncbi:MAG TPA: hypothetical protein VK936_15500 [Longimicrobiales bacterium]|nr:hypothetical protein [Longimicrobiales bacterium]